MIAKRKCATMLLTLNRTLASAASSSAWEKYNEFWTDRSSPPKMSDSDAQRPSSSPHF
jgi:hypothetical protein